MDEPTTGAQLPHPCDLKMLVQLQMMFSAGDEATSPPMAFTTKQIIPWMCQAELIMMILRGRVVGQWSPAAL